MNASLLHNGVPKTKPISLGQGNHIVTGQTMSSMSPGKTFQTWMNSFQKLGQQHLSSPHKHHSGKRAMVVLQLNSPNRLGYFQRTMQLGQYNRIMP